MKHISAITLALFLSACGGDSSTIPEDIDNSNSAPIADAGSDQSISTGVEVNLDAGNSSDVDGDSLSYDWSIISSPTDSVVALDTYTEAEATFIADVDGTYTFQVSVSDGEETSTDEVTITASAATDSGDVSGTESTDGIGCDYSYSEFNDSEWVNTTSTSDWTCSETRDLVANGIPDHDVGEFPNNSNPNAITEQTVVASLTLNPVETDVATTLIGPTGPVAYVLNGVKVDPATAGSCTDFGDSCSQIDNSGGWAIEALGQSSFDFGDDFNNAHVQPGGTYHYHGIPEGFVERQGGNDSEMTLIGWASDGFPIYARYGYSDATDASSSIIEITPSYQHITDISDTRPALEDYEMGTFKQDWEYAEGLGDLDECNGRFGVTPEFPNGIYHYYATDAYPYFQRCVKGEIELGGGSQDGGPEDGAPEEDAPEEDVPEDAPEDAL